jgi:hypothetical protein
MWTYEAAKLFIQELHTLENLACRSLGRGFKNLIFSTDNFVSGNVLPFQISMHAQMMSEL